MSLWLDHVVHSVPDLEAAMAADAALGLHVVPGGRHPGWGTHNALCYFDLTYVELVAVHDRAEAAGSVSGRLVLEHLAAGPGLLTAALAPSRRRRSRS